jgi:hypothetical protein
VRVPDVIDRLPRFIDEVENANRLHSALGCVSPVPIEITNLRGAASSMTGLALSSYRRAHLL